MNRYEWTSEQRVDAETFVCGFCDSKVASTSGWRTQRVRYGSGAVIRICPNCSRPTLFENGKITPRSKPGEHVEQLPSEISKLFGEVRTCIQSQAYTCAAMGARKIIMNVAVDRGAETDLRFIEYVNHLEATGEILPNCKPWVDHIRSQGNTATHEIRATDPDDAKALLEFVTMLLKIVYEFPARLGPSSA